MPRGENRPVQWLSAIGSEVWLLLGSIVITWAAAWLVLQLPSTGFTDDGYVYLRYAQNFADGCGIRFNCHGDAVEGFGGLLWFGLIAAGTLAGVGAVPELWLQLLGIAAMSATVILAVWLSWRLAQMVRTHQRTFVAGMPLGPPLLATIAGVVLLAHPVLMRNAMGGLETTLAACFALALLVVQLDGNFPWLRALVVLGFLSVPEFIFFVPALWVHRSLRSFKYWLPVVAAIVAVTTLRWIYFHDVVPQPFWIWTNGNVPHLSTGMEHLSTLVNAFPLIVFAPLALVVRGSRRAVVAFLVASALWFASLLITGHGMIPRDALTMPLVPALMVLAIFGSGALCMKLLRAAPRAVALPATMAALALVTWGSLERAHDGVRVNPVPEETAGQWEAIGEYLRERHPAAKVAAIYAGGIGYFGKNEMIDLVGRTDRSSHVRPDIIVLPQSRASLTGEKGAALPELAIESFVAVPHFAAHTEAAHYVVFTPKILDHVFAQMLIRSDYLARSHMTTM